ncbi:MBOAT family protein [Sedimentibacter sp. zth1]|uniref:MBOAT family O-acyltransferase n=1 Tax=Sedimentibacter sp. zth1 TaxID=2816908 RepID=UPI001A9293C8|nr:MBOAT family protein [Sedimentibacter sp. zth1]QSX05219.1 MBOAT family protein [Sedimentibacter sp. zth1]
MLFSTYKFIFTFLPIVFLGYYIISNFLPNKYSKIWLILASFYFYSQGSVKFFPIFVFTVFFNYFAGSVICKSKGILRKIALGISLAENILLLGYFKYTNFFIENYNFFTGSSVLLKNIILPIGISFFTFQLIAYLVDCYRDKVENYSILDFLVFITFFPQLIIGPIVHHKDIVPQVSDKSNKKLNLDNVILGIFIFSVGCAKKTFLADPLTAYASQFFANGGYGNMLDGWLSSISYTFSYYFDLSGYADMAIGLGYLFNIKLPQNFNSPYKQRNFRDYWRCWHMSLSRFLSDYVFRSVYHKGDGSKKFYFSVMVTFFVSGFWHGSGWTFVLWGIVNGILVCAAHFMARKKWKMPFFLAWCLTFLGVILTRVMFVSPNFTTMINAFKSLVTITGVRSGLVNFVYNNLYTIILLATSAFICFFTKNTSQITEKFSPRLKYAVFAGFLLALSLFHMNSVTKFLYFQF